MTATPLFRRMRTLIAGTLALALACTPASDGTAPQGNAVLPFHATFGAGVPVATLVVTVTGAGITPPLVFNIPIIGGTANGNVSVPVGSARTILAEAFDTSGVVLYSGSTTINVVAGVNPTVSFSLGTTIGNIPITAVVGTVSITLAPGSSSVRAGTAVTLTSTVKDPVGATIAGAVILFATSSPPTAWPSAAGVITALDTGTVTITGTSLGAAGNATVTVTPGTALDLMTITPATMSAAAGATLQPTVSIRDAGPGGLDSMQVTLQPASGAPLTCKATAPLSGTPANAVFRCNAIAAPGAVAQGTMTVASVQVWWNGPTGGSTLFTPSLLNARGVTATVTVAP